MTIQSLKRGDFRWRVSIVADGDEGMALTNRSEPLTDDSPPELIFLDFESATDSRRVLAEIRASEPLKDLPVVLLTGSLVLVHEAVRQTQMLQADGFLTKPVTLGQSTQLITSLRRSRIADVVVPPLDWNSSRERPEQPATAGHTPDVGLCLDAPSMSHHSLAGVLTP